ncbi:hypothetical protein HGG75_15695 [Ochrobactrum pseudogrignonense]|nr:hypothetical protein [Brucella pseudogrignonensis]
MRNVGATFERKIPECIFWRFSLCKERSKRLSDWQAAPCAMLALQGQASAAGQKLTCMIILNANSGEVIAKEGEICDKRNSPASTFKVPLALMGFESGILKIATTRPALQGGLSGVA